MDADFLFDIIKAKTEKESDKALSDGLYEMCDNLHSYCSGNECLMRTENLVKKGKAADTYFVAVHKEDNGDDEYGCPFFKNGTKMLRALKRISK
jgi:hypothetical protein